MKANSDSSQAFSRQAGLASGLRLRAMRRPNAQTLLTGVYLPTLWEPSTRTLASAALIAAPTGLICGPTCLALHGVALPRRWRDDRQHVWVPVDGNRPKRPQIRVHRTALQLPGVTINDIPCVSPIDAWLQLGADGTVDDLVMVGDGLIRRQHPITTLAAITQAVESSPRRPGIRLLRAAIPLLRARTDSIQETRVRLRVVRAGLPCPTVNIPVLDQYGEVLFLVDMGYEDILLGIEYDGADHVADSPKMQRDAARRRRLEDMGWRIVTVTAADLADPQSGFVASIRQAVQRSVADLER